MSWIQSLFGASYELPNRTDAEALGADWEAVWEYLGRMYE